MLKKIKEWISRHANKNSAPIAEITNNIVSVKFPNGQIQSIDLNNIKAVVIETNNKGPFEEDVYFLLLSNDEINFCGIPQCATGSQEVLKKLQELNGFDNEAVITAMGCTSNKSFLCWEAPDWIQKDLPGFIAARNYRN